MLDGLACQYKVGDAVRHPSYGDGQVREIGKYNKRRHDWPLWIQFQGSQQVMYAKVVATADQASPRPTGKGSSVPTADDVAFAITAAALETGADPTAALTAKYQGHWHQAYHAVLRARSYAAMALFELFDLPATRASQLVGVSVASAKVHLSQLKKWRQTGKIPWWSDESLVRVKLAVISNRLEPIPPKKPPSEKKPPLAARVAKVAPTLPIVLNPPPVETTTITAQLAGDPPYQRSALATAKPWKPYEQSDACRVRWSEEDQKQTERAGYDQGPNTAQ